MGKIPLNELRTALQNTRPLLTELTKGEKHDYGNVAQQVLCRLGDGDARDGEQGKQQGSTRDRKAGDHRQPPRADPTRMYAEPLDGLGLDGKVTLA